MKKIVLTALVLLVLQQTYAQNYKFGKVSVAELEEQLYPKDTTANAAYLYIKRSTSFNYVQGQGFLIETKVHERIKIYNSDGFDWATKSIEYYKSNSGEMEKLSVDEAKTFTLVDGKVTSKKLTKKEVFTEQMNDYWSRKKFTMPNLSSGCILELRYSLISPYNDIDDVYVQQKIPVKKLEVTVAIPDYYYYSRKQKGYILFNIEKERKSGEINFSSKSREESGNVVSSSYQNSSIDFITNIYRINEVNIPALKTEPYVNNINNYRSLVSFELASKKFPEQSIKYYSTTWDNIAENIYNSDRFGGELKRRAHLKDDIAILKAENKSLIDKTSSVLRYVKSKIKWNGNYGEYPENGLRKAYKEGSGNIGDVNLTLVAVLQEMDMEAFPVLVSTRDNGVPIFPTSKGINYLIAAVKTNQGYILLDASEKYSLQNVLPLRALNWKGIVIKKDGKSEFVDLATSIISKEESNLRYKISEDGFIEGMNRCIYQNLSSINYRNNKGSLEKDALISKIEEDRNDIEIVNFRLSNKDNINKPLIEMYTFEKEDGVENIGNKMYVNPMLFNGMDENPFKLESREYPVDFGTPWQDKITVTINIPEGYDIESLPKSYGVVIIDNIGEFKYSIKNIGSSIIINSIVKINIGIVPANYYSELKEFFKLIVAKQTEKIVLSKS